MPRKYSIPSLIDCYGRFVGVRRKFEEEGVIDLRDFDFIFPTTLLPLYDLIFLFSDPDFDNVYLPMNEGVRAYLITMLKDFRTMRMTSFLPLATLPKKQKESDSILLQLFELFMKDQNLDPETENAYKYWINELVDNIYEHSEFENAFVIAQRYPFMDFMETTFFDHGITIAGSFEKIGRHYPSNKHYEAINDALQGVSSKNPDERGFGLHTSVNIILKGLEGEVLIFGTGRCSFERKHVSTVSIR